LCFLTELIIYFALDKFGYYRLIGPDGSTFLSACAPTCTTVSLTFFLKYYSFQL
jgi:hypothetical protein